MRGRRRRQLLAVDETDQLFDAGGDAAREIAGPEFRHDHLVDDTPCRDIGDGALQTVANLDPEVPVVLCNDQERAVVDLLAADFPGFRHPKRELLDRLTVRGRHDQHRDLAALAPFEIGERLAHLRDIAARQRAGPVDHAPRELGHCHQRDGRKHPAQQQGQQSRA